MKGLPPTVEYLLRSTGGKVGREGRSRLDERTFKGQQRGTARYKARSIWGWNLGYCSPQAIS